MSAASSPTQPKNKSHIKKTKKIYRVFRILLYSTTAVLTLISLSDILSWSRPETLLWLEACWSPPPFPLPPNLPTCRCVRSWLVYIRPCFRVSLLDFNHRPVQQWFFNFIEEKMLSKKIVTKIVQFLESLEFCPKQIEPSQAFPTFSLKKELNDVKLWSTSG